ncbi:MAG: hypothetical protein KAJ51_08945 [Thermoplasmata archaeon]|nr:hypothetical protein [Thermoplasmata archaeon]
MSKRSKSDLGAISEPPWIWGPTEGYQWARFAYAGEKAHKVKHRKSRNVIQNPHLQIDLNIKKNLLLPKGFIQRILIKKLELGKLEEHFDIVVTAEKFLEALDRAKFKNINEIKIDNNVIYFHLEKNKDVLETIEILIAQGDNWQTSKSIKITATTVKLGGCKAIIAIKRVHSKQEHAIDVRFMGELKRNLFKQFVNYVKRNLEVRDID